MLQAALRALHTFVQCELACTVTLAQRGRISQFPHQRNESKSLQLLPISSSSHLNAFPPPLFIPPEPPTHPSLPFTLPLLIFVLFLFLSLPLHSPLPPPLTLPNLPHSSPPPLAPSLLLHHPSLILTVLLISSSFS